LGFAVWGLGFGVWYLGCLNPLSLTPSRLPRFKANERRSFPHAFSRQKSKNRGESDISEMKLSDFPCFSGFSSNFLGKKTDVVACGAQNSTKLLRKRDWNGKYPSMRSTKEMTVKLEIFLAV
jgi:hypothetical protein